MSTTHDKILALLPADGARALVRRVEDSLREQRVRGARSALTELCAERRAIVETIGGYTFARRVVEGVAPPPVARPAWKPPRLRQGLPTGPST